ncbi:hypothetical protein, partial [Mycobacterium sp.]|uniref:hypothetical protein n=1 Tax=Mycobacterium sp. TaxID=1785 RepID=UPI0025EA67E6
MPKVAKATHPISAASGLGWARHASATAALRRKRGTACGWASATAGVTASIGTACARLDDTAAEPQSLL